MPGPQFPQFWLGVKYRAPCLGQNVPPGGELQRRSVEKGYISGNHTLPGYRGAMRSSRTRSRRTLSRTPGSRAIGDNAHRQSLGHVCTIASSPFFRGAGCVSENQSGQWDVSRDADRSTRASISAPPPQGGASISRASAPVSTGCLLLDCGPPGCKLLEETTTSIGTTGGFGMPVCKVDVTANPPGDLCRRPPMCYLSGQAHGSPWDLLGILERKKYSQHLQMVDVPWEMMVLPQTLTRASL